MPAPKPLHRKANAASNDDVHAAEDYLASILSSEEDFSQEEVQSIRESVEAIRRGEMTLAEFEEKHGL